MKKEKNCVNCKFGLFGRCEGLKDNEEYQSIWENKELSTMERWAKVHEFNLINNKSLPSSISGR